MAAIFITGSTDMSGANSRLYQQQLKQVLDNCIARKDYVITGDQPGVESITQAYLASKRYDRVGIKHLNKSPRKLANKDWFCERQYTPPVAENGKPMHILQEGYHRQHGYLSNTTNSQMRDLTTEMVKSSNVSTASASSGTVTQTTA